MGFFQTFHHFLLSGFFGIYIFSYFLYAVDKGNIEREKERLQRDYDDSKRRYEKKLEEKNKEIREHVEYESKMNSENLRRRERDNIENEKDDAVDGLFGLIKRIGLGIVKAGKSLFSIFAVKS